MDTKISIAFLDRTEEDITVSLNKNCLLYGLNGQGKTRVLKTIDLLISFSKKENFLDSFKLLKDLNLKSLTINGIPYEELFLVKDSIENIQDNNFIEWMQKKESQLEIYIAYLDMFYKRMVDLDDFTNSYRKRLSVLISRLKRMVKDTERTKYNLDNFVACIDELNRLFYIFDKFNREERLLSFNEENAMRHSLIYQDYREIIYLGEDILNSLKVTIDFSDIELMKKFDIEKNKVKSALNNTITKYITTENLMITEIEQYIKNKIFLEKNRYFENIWNDRKVSDNFFIDLKSKLRDLNRLLNNYMKVEIHIDFDGNILFKKSNEEIDFHKLSSGEKRVIILFSSITFFEANLFLIDEPELSLSLNFQNRLVNDLNRLIGNNNMIVATHAPFIFKDFKLLENYEIVNV